MAKKYDWVIIRNAVNKSADEGKPLSQIEICTRYKMSMSTLSYRIEEDTKKGIEWKTKYIDRKIKHKEKELPEEIDLIDANRKALKRAYVLIKRVTNPSEMNKLADAIVKLTRNIKELTSNGTGEIEDDDEEITMPDGFLKVINGEKE
jgi:hypothetical protein